MAKPQSSASATKPEVADLMVDLRSDTVTKPTAAMRKAMAEAEVGDDGYGEDPTVNRLEAMFAERVGKEAAVYVPSGTMANQLALRCLGRPGSMVLAGRRQHVVIYEAGAAATNSTAQLVTVDDTGGVLPIEEVRAAIEAANHHQPPVAAICAENTHMPAGGVPWPDGRLDRIAELGVPVHLDGARLFNAAVATGRSLAELAAPATTVMCCMSKGLAAPVGSLLAGPGELIARARPERKRLGGAMRQAGVIAAAGVVALDAMVERLAEDHERASRVAQAVEQRWPGSLAHEVATNVVLFEHRSPAKVIAHLAGHGVLAGTIAPGVVRLMTHVDVNDEGLDRACEALLSCEDGT